MSINGQRLVRTLVLPLRHRMWRRVVAVLIVGLLALLTISGPFANHLQMRHRYADPQAHWDAVYLVCGARAQRRRIASLLSWVERGRQCPVVLVGNDSQPGFWSSAAQRNLTRTEWGVITLSNGMEQLTLDDGKDHHIRVVPGKFSNTDGEMRAFAAYLQTNTYHRIALVTCRFHARRVIRRAQTYLPADVELGIVPAKPFWEDRAPWVVLGEYLKLLRDALGYAQTPLLTRSMKE